jgi:hypothetical protein
VILQTTPAVDFRQHPANQDKPLGHPDRNRDCRQTKLSESSTCSFNLHLPYHADKKGKSDYEPKKADLKGQERKKRLNNGQQTASCLFCRHLWFAGIISTQIVFLMYYTIGFIQASWG